MYIRIDQTKIMCDGFNMSRMRPAFFGLNENPLPLCGLVELAQDDGFVLFSCEVADFARVSYADGTLILSNEPELEPPPVPEEPVERPPTPDEDRDALLVDLDYRLTLVELGISSQ